MSTTESIPTDSLPSSHEQETPEARRARLMLRYIDTHIVGNHEGDGEDVDEDAKELKDLRTYYAGQSPRDRANALYAKVLAYEHDKHMAAQKMAEQRAAGETPAPVLVDSDLVREIRVLAEDEAVRALVPETYGTARIDTHDFRKSKLGVVWRDTHTEVVRKEDRYKELERKKHLDQFATESERSSAESTMARLAMALTRLEKRQHELADLVGYEHTQEHADAAAQFSYEQLRAYQQELQDGFVWLPSRKRIHEETVSALLNHRWPVLKGEAGSGKSDQADAAAIELTGVPPTTIACSARTSERDLIKDIAVDPETGGSYEVYGPLMQALTGYEDSRQAAPTFTNGRIVRFDEAYRIPHESAAYAIIKEARQCKPGDTFFGKPVLPGAGAIWTTNPPGPRYPGRFTPDAALRREVAEIEVPYPCMSNDDPELYEFALAALLDEHGHITAAKSEIGPAYERVDIAESAQKVLENGDRVVAREELVVQSEDYHHGALWRFSAALKAVQDSFVYGNADTQQYPATLLRYKENASGEFEITTDGSGTPLTLSSSTVTLGELASWMHGFNERMEKRDPAFRTETLSGWLTFKTETYLKQADEADRGKLRAIFTHFGILGHAVPNIRNERPLTPKDIGYLSPRVPRPLHVEKKVVVPEGDQSEGVVESVDEVREYETKAVLLEDGTRVLLKVQECTVGEGAGAVQVSIGSRYVVNGESYTFAGVVSDESNPQDGFPIGKVAGGDALYRVSSFEELDGGLLESFVLDREKVMTELQQEVDALCADEEKERATANV